MALTIRTITDEERDMLESLKRIYRIKTDTKAFIMALTQWSCLFDAKNKMQEEIYELRSELEDYKRIMHGLEIYLAPALEKIQQQELDL